MKFRLAISILLSILLISNTSYAATPTPKPSVTAKPSPTPAATKSTSTAQSSPSSTSTKKPTKKPVKKKRVKKTATPIPSPLPVWPPVGFTANNGIYAKIPSGKELLGLISAKIGLATAVENIDEIINPKTLKIRMVRICILEVNQPAKGVKIAVATILPVTTQEI